MSRPYKSCEINRIERMVRAAAFALKPDLVYLFHRFGEDHGGDDSIFFNMVASDELIYHQKEWTKRIWEMEKAITMIVEPCEYDLCFYFSVRSLRECRQMKDEDYPIPEEELSSAL